MRLLIAAILLCVSTVVARAQDSFWIQIEARPSLVEAQARAQFYSEQRENVAGYYLNSGWYAIALGPYDRNDARRLMGQLKSRGVIPSDSYLASGAKYRTQFWPVGRAAPTTAQPLPGSTPTAPALPTEPGDTAEAAPEAAAQPLRDPGETRAEAATSEGELTREEKRELQTALKWEGFYNSAIDGLYGKGTRRSMAAWQEANRYQATGILTTKQRAELLANYNAILDGMDMQLVQDDASGLRMLLPTGVMAFTRYDPPFVRFDPTGKVEGAQVLFISQEGDSTTLTGLYEVLQTLELFPRDGERTLKQRSFRIEAMDNTRHTTAVAGLKDGQIKGFVLSWPAGDERRRARVLNEIERSYTEIDGVLDPALVTGGATQAVDMVSGLAVRKPRVNRSGFFINDAGDVLTSADAVQNCGELTLQGDHPAEVVLTENGVAVLRATEPQAPRASAEFQTSEPRLQSQVAVSGFPYDGALSTAAVTFGTLADVRGLNGETDLHRLTLTAAASEAGGPVFDNAGHVIGMLLPPMALNGKVLPQDVAFTVPAAKLLQTLDAAEIGTTRSDSVAFVTPEDVTDRAAKMTVLVSCWD